jgi:very-short-patch-repair endonuclease
MILEKNGKQKKVKTGASNNFIKGLTENGWSIKSMNSEKIEKEVETILQDMEEEVPKKTRKPRTPKKEN